MYCIFYLHFPEPIKICFERCLSKNQLCVKLFQHNCLRSILREYKYSSINNFP